MTEPLKRKRLRFYGAVQGVGFRWRARNAASAAGATGWVRNDPDGSVAMELQGSEAQMDRVLAELERSLWIRIDALEAREIPPEPDERGFYTLDDTW